MSMNIAIVGGGPAAVEAAIAARNTAPDSAISLFSAEKLLPYRRPMLSGLLKGTPVNEKVFFIKPENFYAENNISLHLDTPVDAIGDHCLLTASGEKIAFDRLIIATGGKARVPQLPTAPGALVFALREYLDMVKINAFIGDCRSVAVIGGGVLGLEIADSMLARNLQCTVLECSGQLFPGKLAPDAAAELKLRLANIPGFAIHCNARAAGINRAGVICENGMLIPAEAVIFAAGSTPRTLLAQEAGIAVGRGIIADEKMQSSHPDIFTAGDAAEFNGRTFGLYLDAVATGKVAGINAAGGSAQFTPATTPTRLVALGEKLTL